MQIKHFISILFMFFATLPGLALYQEVEIRMRTDSSLYFDQKVLQEIIESSEQESVEVVAQKLNDFSSSPLSIQSDGQFYIEDYSGKTQDVQLNPRTAQHAHYIFSLTMQVNQNFARGYALLVAKLGEDLLKALEAAVELSMPSIKVAELQYSYFYTCLQNVAIMTDPKTLGCLDVAIRQIGFSKPADALHLANLYMKMYRLSRLSFNAISKRQEVVRSKDKKFSFTHDVYTRHYQPIDLNDPELLEICKLMANNFGKISHLKDSFTRVDLPTWGWSAFKWDHLGGKEESAKKLKLFHSIPDLMPLTGPYFDGHGGAGQYVSNQFQNQERLCRRGLIY